MASKKSDILPDLKLTQDHEEFQGLFASVFFCVDGM